MELAASRTRTGNLLDADLLLPLELLLNGVEPLALGVERAPGVVVDQPQVGTAPFDQPSLPEKAVYRPRGSPPPAGGPQLDPLGRCGLRDRELKGEEHSQQGGTHG
jgi:hypothetical protein